MGFLKSKKKVSLVLGSGGARGLVHIGVIKALLEKGYIIDEIVGCSIGSLVGAAFAQNKLNELDSWMRKINAMQIFKLMDFADLRLGLVKGAKVFDSLKEVFDDEKIENLSIKYVAVASDLRSESDVVFSSGSVFEAIRASIAIPGFFTGIDLDNRYMVDGGVLNPLPINYVTRRRRNIIIAVNLDGRLSSDYGNTLENKKFGSVAVMQDSYLAMRRRLSRLTVQICKPDYVIDIPHNICGLWDYNKSEYLISQGERYLNALVPDSKTYRKANT